MFNGRVFDTNIIIEFGMSTLFDVVSIQEWIHVLDLLHHIYMNPKCVNSITKWN